MLSREFSVPWRIGPISCTRIVPHKAEGPHQAQSGMADLEIDSGSAHGPCPKCRVINLVAVVSGNMPHGGRANSMPIEYAMQVSLIYIGDCSKEPCMTGILLSQGLDPEWLADH
ncbi:hypothetical protein LIA77_05761 [Sarocladium implicatum]|nr:hypothetical protein LIA77_05761 [Sarocladium implicatum]